MLFVIRSVLRGIVIAAVGVLAFESVVGLLGKSPSDLARQYAAPVFWYVDAPAREAELIEKHSLEVKALQEELAAALAYSGTVAAELAHQKDLFSGAESVIQRMGDELGVARAELAGTRSRYAALCQRLLDLGNDVPSALVAE